ncbi:MAG TPA: SGNH/GDSL hydrolase family protein [Candidatus Acidoferrales bacterium]|nr:SGNH/GDSL hydrolase family protein [Candidatus Acidoferrales bacterium]
MPPEDSTDSKSPDAGFSNQTVRMIVRVSIGGKELRVRFSNAFGTAPVTIGIAHVALAGKDAAILPGTDRALTFSGQPSFSIPPGAMVLSDPVRLDVPALTRLAVSVFLSAATGPATWHALGNQTTFISAPGDFTASADMPVAKTTESWYWLSGVDVLAGERTAAVVTLGDSITDGAQSTLDANHRWPDILADQLSARNGGASLAVLNEGISGNRLLHDVAGPNALARFDRDVLAQDGVRYLIVLEGINDIGWPHIPDAKYAGDAVSAGELTAALRQIAERAHSRGIQVFGGTLTPFGGAFYETADGEAERVAVNQWIRTSGAFDGVIDFDELTRDPSHPQQFLPTYDSGDHLHPGDAGYEAMGRAAARVFQSVTSTSPSRKRTSRRKMPRGAFQ